MAVRRPVKRWCILLIRDKLIYAKRISSYQEQVLQFCKWCASLKRVHNATLGEIADGNRPRKHCSSFCTQKFFNQGRLCFTSFSQKPFGQPSVLSTQLWPQQLVNKSLFIVRVPTKRLSAKLYSVRRHGTGRLGHWTFNAQQADP